MRSHLVTFLGHNMFKITITLDGKKLYERSCENMTQGDYLQDSEPHDYECDNGIKVASRPEDGPLALARRILAADNGWGETDQANEAVERREKALEWQKKQRCTICGTEIELKRIIWTIVNNVNLPKTCANCSFNKKHNFTNQPKQA